MADMLAARRPPARAQKAAKAPERAPKTAPPAQAAAPAPAADNQLPRYLQARRQAADACDPLEREADALAAHHAPSLAPGLAVPAAPAWPTTALQRPPPSQPASLQRSEAAASATPLPSLPPEPGAAALATAGLPTGPGRPIPPPLRRRLQAALGQPLGPVRLHTDGAADARCRAQGARAMTQGRNIFFAQGEFDPATEAGRTLLLHELAHVLQQAGGTPMPQRKAFDSQGREPDHTQRGAAYRDLLTVDIPASKTRHAATYRNMAGLPDNHANKLRRPRGATVVRRTRQVGRWTEALTPQVTSSRVRQKLQQMHIAVPAAADGRIALSINGRDRLEGTLDALTERLLRPRWDREGTRRLLQVDHKVEYQVAASYPLVDTIGNFELLDPFLNGSSGATLMNAIRRKVTAFLRAAAPEGVAPSDGDVSQFLAEHALEFDAVNAPGGAVATQIEVGSWTQAQIEALQPLDRAREVLPAGSGDASTLALASGAGGFQLARLAHAPGATRLAITNASQQTAIAGIRLQAIDLTGSEGAADAGQAVGTLHGAWHLPDGWTAREALAPLALKSGGAYLTYPDVVPAFELDFRELSPVRFTQVSWQDGELHASGQLTPSLNLLRTPIDVTLQGRDISFSLTYTTDGLQLPIPGVQIDETSLTVLYSTVRGFGAMGNLGFSVPRLGHGLLTAGATTGGGFEASGEFSFDPDLFDRAAIRMAYRRGQLSAEGEIGIDRPDRVRGIRSAALSVGYEAGGFRASGSVQPSIPGVREAGLTVAYAEADGLTIGGNLQLAANPAIRSGSIAVTLRKPADRWLVQASGSAVPAIPGLASELTVTYDDGAFDARFQGAFERGLLSGTVEAGATNRAIDALGQPAGEALPDAPLVVYGGGSATLRLAPWLQGTAGLRFAPDGEVTVQGEIGLPSALSLFDRREVQRRLFGLSVQVPIVPGILAEVGGNLTAVAGIGPGVLEQLRIAITYNPAHEEDTHLTGDAHLRVPADAGLRLGARAGIGLGIPGASATGGIELGGMAGIAGAAEATVHIDWRPGSGLAIDAEAALHAEPVFRFDVSGYVSVQALGFSVYDERWQLAAMEVGSGLGLGVRFPVHYQQGQPFDVSVDDVQFDLPPIDTMGLVRQVLAQVG